ncbi:hypothetical protein MSG28_012995 [Choristoneura fumiferana]|uniref:Uncharacterized protein n=1 Tax=Choristoneura fumiferana TaxID=7141 RepID=A0ACC0KS76_CHOFU|nr:hypothetical protein MSG28_012995 [Choristoneura fumiferana]
MPTIGTVTSTPTRHPTSTASTFGVHSLSTGGLRVDAALTTSGPRVVHEFPTRRRPLTGKPVVRGLILRILPGSTGPRSGGSGRYNGKVTGNFTGCLTLHAETQQCKHCCFTAGLATKMVVAIRADLAQGPTTCNPAAVLLLPVFPEHYNLAAFKSRMNEHLLGKRQVTIKLLDLKASSRLPPPKLAPRETYLSPPHYADAFRTLPELIFGGTQSFTVLLDEPLVSGTQVRNSTRAEDFIRQPRAERLPRSEAEQVEALPQRHEANPSPRADPLSIYLPCSKEPQSEHGGWSEVFLDGWELVDVDREDRAGAGADPVDHGVLEQRVTVAASLQRCGKNRVEVTSGVVEGCKEKDQLKW